MYQALLTRRYLTTKVMPLLAIVAVMLCTAMVLIVWSVMGGFLVMLLNSGRTLMGDVAVSWPTSGFAYYEEFVERLEAQPEVAAATPVIETGGSISLPDGRVEWLMIKGIHGPSYGEVTGYADSLWWKPLEEPMPKDVMGKDLLVVQGGRAFEGRILDETDTTIRFRIEPTRVESGEEGPKERARIEVFNKSEIAGIRRGRWQDPRLDGDPKWAKLYEDGLRLQELDERTGGPRSAIVLGIEVTGFNERTDGGVYIPQPFGVRTESGGVRWRDDFIPESNLLISLYPQGRSGRPVDVVSRILPVANEFRTGVFEIDSKTALVEFSELQRMLKMDAAPRVADPAGGGGADPYGVVIDPETGREQFEAPRVVEMDPARATTVLVRGIDRVGPDQLAAVVRRVYRDFAAAHPGELPAPPPETGRVPPGAIVIQTWEQRQGTMIEAVKNEIGMMLSILLFLSLVASFLILAIFWAMVSEKTKDIGILRSLGASKLGVAWLWLRYGLVIGLIGSVLGVAFAHVFVWNINAIHEWLGRNLGLTVWNPKVYYFTEIPHAVDPANAAVVLVGGLVFSILGALVPAVKAANMDPVRALRFE